MKAKWAELNDFTALISKELNLMNSGEGGSRLYGGAAIPD